MEKVYDAMLESIAQRTADIIWERIEPYLQGNSQQLITRQEVMEMLGVSGATLWKWERNGTLKSAGSFGRRVYYDLNEVKKQLKN